MLHVLLELCSGPWKGGERSPIKFTSGVEPPLSGWTVHEANQMQLVQVRGWVPRLCCVDRRYLHNSSKVTAIQRFPTPTDLKSLHSFLGLDSCYTRFVPSFLVTASPLFSLTCNVAAFNWEQLCQQAFQQLKSSYSGTGSCFPQLLGGLLLGEGYIWSGNNSFSFIDSGWCKPEPIAFASCSSRHMGATIASLHDLEGLAVLWAVKDFCQYLYGHKCHPVIDHETLKSLLNSPHPSGKWELI